MTTERKRQLLLGIFIMALLLANTLGAKIAEFPIPAWLYWPLDVVFYPVIWLFNNVLIWTGNDVLPFHFFDTIHVSVGILTVPLMALVTDVVSEVWGRKETQNFIKTGVVVMVIMIAVTYVSVLLPPAQRFIDMNNAYSSIFTVTVRMSIASILAFYLSELNDVWTFFILRKKTKGRFLWLRTGVSTAISEMVDTVIFMFVAFYDPTSFPAQMVVKLIIPYYIFKFLVGILDIPFTYLGVWWVRRGVKAGEVTAVPVVPVTAK